VVFLFLPGSIEPERGTQEHFSGRDRSIGIPVGARIDGAVLGIGRQPYTADTLGSRCARHGFVPAVIMHERATYFLRFAITILKRFFWMKAILWH